MPKKSNAKIDTALLTFLIGAGLAAAAWRNISRVLRSPQIFFLRHNNGRFLNVDGDGRRRG